MSRENVEVVRQVYEAAARRDRDLILRLYDPGIEIDNTYGRAQAFAPGIFKGHEGLRAFWREWNEAWEETGSSIEELIDAGDNVVAVTHHSGRGRASGAEVSFTVGTAWTIGDGRIIRLAFFPSREEALEAVGLGE